MADVTDEDVETIKWATVEIERLRAELAAVTERKKWVCYHCGFEATTPEEAEAHFGPAFEGEESLCRFWHSMDDAERAHEYQQMVMELDGTRDELFAAERQLASVTAERDELRAELEMSEARHELLTAAYERAVKIVEVGPNAAAKAEAKALSDSARTLQELQETVKRLHAELMQAPPTLEWLRERFGSRPEVTVQSTGYDAYHWSCGVKYREPHGRVSCPPGNLCKTRAAVLAAVANTNTSEEPPR